MDHCFDNNHFVQQVHRSVMAGYPPGHEISILYLSHQFGAVPAQIIICPKGTTKIYFDTRVWVLKEGIPTEDGPSASIRVVTAPDVRSVEATIHFYHENFRPVVVDENWTWPDRLKTTLNHWVNPR